MRALLFSALFWASPAMAWPAVDAWTELPTDATELTGDLVSSDFAGLDLTDTGGAAVRVAADDTYLYLGQRVAADPLAGGTGFPVGAVWAYLIDTDGPPASGDAAYEVEFSVSGVAGTIEAFENPLGSTGLRPAGLLPAAPDGGGSWGNLVSNDVRVVAQDSGTYTVELRIARDDLDATFGISDDTPLYLAMATGDGFIGPRFDVAGCDTRTDSCTTLSPVLTEPFTIDIDQDGLTDLEELALGTDPYDADSDDDGLLDGEEADALDTAGEPAALSCDSDGDGIFDGTESGVRVPGPDTDEDAGCFIPDTDDETTDPRDRDTDGGGIPDGREDRNGNGSVDDDCYETDPNDADDDLDTDGDGVPDVLESRGADGNIDDVDSDGDGVADAVEGLADPDGDCIPAFLDLDSDGDGLLDIDEGGDDPDGDGIPSNLDLDSDGNGVLDADEPVGDQDCDGIPNWLDVNDVDSLCDDPDVDTDPDTETPGYNPERTGYFAGGGCSMTGGPTGAGWLVLLALGAVVRRRRTLVLAAASVGTASAQQVDSQRFRATVDQGVLIGVEDGDVGPKNTGSVGLLFDYANDPLVYRYSDGAGGEDDIVGNVLTANVLGGISLGRVRLGADLPIHPYVSGGGVDQTVALGDLRLSSELQLLDQDGAGPLNVGALVDLSLPTGSGGQFLGAARTRVTVGGAVSRSFGPVTLASHMGFRTGTGTTIGRLKVSPAFIWAAGAGIQDGRVGVSLEADGEYWAGNDDQRGRRPAEWRAVATVLPVERLELRLGGGSALSQGLGAPDFRLFCGARVRLGAMSVAEEDIVSRPMDPAATTGRVQVRVLAPSGAPVSNAVVRVGPERERTNAAGIIEVEVDPGAWDVIVEADPYRWQLDDVGVSAGDRVVLVASLRPQTIEFDLIERRIYTTQTIFFELDSDVLTSQSSAVLAVLAEALKEHTEVERVRIEGHTDSQGRAEYNLDLSRRRAASVMRYLTAVGIDPDRLESQGYGEERLLQQGDIEDVHAVNRRVEFHIVEIDE